MSRARALALGLLLTACTRTADAPLRVSDAWLRAMPEGVTSTAGYLSVENRSRERRELTAVTSPQFARVELHETRVEDGMARMRAVDRLALAPGERVTLAPGGLHLMLLDPVRTLTPGEHATLRLQLDDGWLVEVEAEVRAP
jgi:copper(I)-binding protein